jgi:transcriptional regulator with XRE-family HTH domain
MVTAKQEANFSKHVGEAIAKTRLGKGLTQEQVAVAIGVEQETISRFERGATLPTLSRLMDIAELLGVSLDSLVRAGSSRPMDVAIDLVVMLSRLNENDRQWVREFIAQLCEKLAAR